MKEDHIKKRTAVAISLLWDSTVIRTDTVTPLTDMHAPTLAPAKPSRRIEESLFQCTISIPWVFSVEKKDGKILMQRILTHERSGKVRLLQNVHINKQVRKLLCRSGYGEDLKEWSEIIFVAGQFGEFDERVVPKEADRQRLLFGEEIDLRLCTPFIRDRAPPSKIRLRK